MTVEVELANGAPTWLEYVTAFGTAGAAIAAAGAAWIAVRQSKRATVRQLHFAVGAIDVLAMNHATMTIIVTNDGFRPITLKQVGLKYATGEAIVLDARAEQKPDMPTTLADGAAGDWVFNANDVIEALAGDKKALVQMFAVDSRGVEYTSWWLRRSVKRRWLLLRERRRQRQMVKQVRDELLRRKRDRAG